LLEVQSSYTVCHYLFDKLQATTKIIRNVKMKKKEMHRSSLPLFVQRTIEESNDSSLALRSKIDEIASREYLTYLHTRMAINARDIY